MGMFDKEVRQFLSAQGCEIPYHQSFQRRLCCFAVEEFMEGIFVCSLQGQFLVLLRREKSFETQLFFEIEDHQTSQTLSDLV